MDFQGTAKPLNADAVARAAEALHCEQAAIRAVIAVESRGGFDSQGRPKILFERHYFHRLTQGRFAAEHPDISARRWGGYGPAARQYERLGSAIALDREAALRSASWGMFQIMGDNFAAAGFANIEAMVAAMMESEDRHLQAFCAFVTARGLAHALARRDWAAFARGYNGPAYAANRYDIRLAEAYTAASGGTLRRGHQGAAVRDLQTLLGVKRDGHFGLRTEAAVRAFQRAAGLIEDGVVGPATREVLGRAGGRGAE